MNMKPSFLNGGTVTGHATVLGIGTAAPSNVVNQSTYPDYYFRVTGCEDMVKAKERLARICEKTAIRKRHFWLTEDMLNRHPDITVSSAPTIALRQEIAAEAIPKLAEEASRKALKEWGRPAADITHLVFCSTTAPIRLPGPDCQLVELLGLRPTVVRTKLILQGCFGGATAIRTAKEIVESSGKLRSRVLVVCSESTTQGFTGLDRGCESYEETRNQLLVASVFGDGAAALVVGTNPIAGVERPIFELVSSAQTILPDSKGYNVLHLTETILECRVARDLATVVGRHIESFLQYVLQPVLNEKKDIMVNHHALGQVVQGAEDGDWNSLFWVMHAGGRDILDQIESKLQLRPEKLQAARAILANYGNMSSASVFFVLDEIRRRSVEKALRTTGEGVELGLLIALGPGMTLEAVVLRSVHIHNVVKNSRL